MAPEATWTPAMEARLAHVGSSPELALVLLDDAQLDKLGMFLSELSHVEIGMPKAIADNATLHDVNNLMGRASKAYKELELLRRSRLQPLEDETSSVNELFRPVTTRLKALVDAGKALLVGWEEREAQRVARERAELERLRQEAARKEGEALAKAEAAKTEKGRQAALARAAEANEAASQALSIPEPVAPRGARSEHATSTVRHEWDFQIVDASLIPREYLMPDEKKLRAAVRSMGVREIPGVAISQKAVATVRSR